MGDSMKAEPEVARFRSTRGRPIARAFLAAAILLLPAAAFAQSGAAPVAKTRCVGNACAGVTVDLTACTVTNAGDKTVSVELIAGGRAPVQISAVSPGETRSLTVCVKPSDLRLYTVNERDPAPGGEKGKKVSPDSAFATGGKRSICTGNACADATIEARAACAWMENIGKHEIAIEALVAKETVRLTLEAPDEKKAERFRLTMEKLRAERDASAQRKGPTRADCERRQQFEKMMKDQQSSRTPALVTPEQARFNEACRQLMQAAAPSVAQEINAYHSHTYRPLSNSFDGATYRAKLMPASGCAAMSDVRSFKATYVSYVPSADDGKLPCTGNACADLVYESEICALRNKGRRMMIVKVVSKERGVTHGPFPVTPGQGWVVREMSGCLRPAGMASVEAASQ
jgi:hypothetical protein